MNNTYSLEDGSFWKVENDVKELIGRNIAFLIDIPSKTIVKYGNIDAVKLYINELAKKYETSENNIGFYLDGLKYFEFNNKNNINEINDFVSKYSLKM